MIMVSCYGLLQLAMAAAGGLPSGLLGAGLPQCSNQLMDQLMNQLR